MDVEASGGEGRYLVVMEKFILKREPQSGVRSRVDGA